MSTAPKLVLAITGGSGAIYSVRLLEVLLAAGHDVHLSMSPAGKAVFQAELGLEIDLHEFPVERRWSAAEVFPGPWREPLVTVKSGERGTVHYHHYQNLLAPIASGSHRTRGMVICPASGGTVSAIAHGTSGNLIQRAADVHLKERRRLILVPRETPLSAIQLDNLKRCAEAGAVVLPAMPGFYHGATSVPDLVDFVVARICDQLEIDNGLMKRWGETE
jgi:4-hydroxy-3-polyprenylbenzoate decarboxylase